MTILMIPKFPYKILDKTQLCDQMNSLGNNRSPFLFVINFNADSGYLIEEKDIDSEQIKFSFEQTTNLTNDCCLQKIQWDIEPLSLEEYKLKFDYVVDQIHKGNSFLTNLTQPTKITTNFTLEELYSYSAAKYKLWIKDQFVVLSPETFVEIKDGIISSNPMKGTIDASIENAAEIILNDIKEKAEHATIVDLIRNDLSLVATEVEVKRYRYIEELKTNKQNLLQVSSEIVGRLAPNYHQNLGTILFSLLPAGSICGAPKPKTLEIINAAEGYSRGFYTGICGWFDGANLNSAVMIRFIEQVENGLIFKSGGGITSKSDLEKEYEELIQKVYVPIS